MKDIAIFDAADYLDDDAVVAEYLNAALEDSNPDLFLQAIADVAKARGITNLARATGMGRESLYKTLSREGNPELETVLRVCDAVGLKLKAVPG